MKDKNISGKKYGSWTVIERFGKDQPTKWVCECVCGTKREVLASNIKRGKSTSCGCQKHLPEGVSSQNALFSGYKRVAFRRGLKFSLTKDEFLDLTLLDCYYCGEPPKQEKKHIDLWGSYIYNGVDRVNNNLGYTKENCVPCCGRCNRAKSTYSADEFILWIRKIYKYSIECQ